VIGKIEATLGAMLSDPSVAVRVAASDAMDRLRAKRSVPVYLEKLRTGSLEERVRIVFAAEEIGGAEGLSLLLAALSDGEPEVRGAAVRALESSLSPAVLKSLVSALPRESGVVLGNLLEVLGKSYRKELSPILEKYLDHPDYEVRGKAIVAFARAAGGAGWEKILRHAGAESETVRAAAARALGEWSDDRG
jgi:HEAT repeat protein